MTSSATPLEIHVSPALKALLKVASALHPRIVWRACDVLAYDPRIVCSTNPPITKWDIGNKWEDAEMEEDLLEEVKDSLKEPSKLPYRS